MKWYPPGKDSDRKQMKTFCCTVSSIWLWVKPYRVIPKTIIFHEGLVCADLRCIIQSPQQPSRAGTCISPISQIRKLYLRWVPVSRHCSSKCRSQDFKPRRPVSKAGKSLQGNVTQVSGPASGSRAWAPHISIYRKNRTWFWNLPKPVKT